MILDSSAVVAVLFREPGCGELVEKIGAATSVAISAANLVESTIVCSHRLGHDARGLLARFLDEADVTVIPLSDVHASAATDAWLRFGRTRHPAALNFGDCLAYATAAIAAEPLLCVGDDFPQTDLPLA